MSHGHIDTDLLARFTEGEVGPDLAVSIALHLDECPQCAAIAQGTDPLAAAFASSDDAPVPEGLVAAVMAADLAPEVSRPSAEPWVAAILLLSAGVAATGGSTPGGLLTHAWMVGKACIAAGSALLSSGSVSWPLAAAAAAGALCVTVATSHVAARRVAA